MRRVRCGMTSCPSLWQTDEASTGCTDAGDGDLPLLDGLADERSDGLVLTQ